jgi:hypothetical protein
LCREKELLASALEYVNRYEKDEVLAGKVDFQLELKLLERAAADLREAERVQFAKEVQARALYRSALATIEVNMGPAYPKQNLTIQEGEDLKVVGKF